MTAPASVILSQNDFDKMEPGSILVAPNTTPAWTQLFAHAVGLVTDMGSILAHGSIVAREYGIPAVLGVGNGTVRIQARSVHYHRWRCRIGDATRGGDGCRPIVVHAVSAVISTIRKRSP